MNWKKAAREYRRAAMEAHERAVELEKTVEALAGGELVTVPVHVVAIWTLIGFGCVLVAAAIKVVL